MKIIYRISRRSNEYTWMWMKWEVIASLKKLRAIERLGESSSDWVCDPNGCPIVALAP